MNVQKIVVGWSLFGAALCCVAVCSGRGESWMPKPSLPPAVTTLTNEARYVEWKWRTDVTDRTTGVDQAAARKEVSALATRLEPSAPWNVVKAKCFAWLCDNLAIDVSALDWYPSFACWDRYARPLKSVLDRRDEKIAQRFYPEIIPEWYRGNQEGRWCVWKDFDHIIPDWETVVPLGFPGLKARLKANWKDLPYYRAEQITADAIDRLLDRLIAQGEVKRKRPGEQTDARRSRLGKQIASLKRLRTGPPRTAYDVLQFIYLYFVLSEHFECVQARSLSVIDVTLWPHYRDDLAAGRTTETEFREQFAHFLWQWGSIDNYWGQPVTMGGTNADGTTAYNPLSPIILDVVDQCALPTPKFHLKVAENTPPAILWKALDMVRRHRSFSFVGEEPVRRVLEHSGYDADAARRFVTRGCYEFNPPEAGNGLGGGHSNLPKVVELMLADAAAGRFDAPDFEFFKREYLKHLVATVEKVLGFFCVFEQHLDDVNPALVGSLAGAYSVATGKDALSTGTRTGNRTGHSLSGYGTAVDALIAVKELVYERKELTLAELGRLMAADWKGREDLHLRMLRSKRKWGNNDPEANALGAEIARTLSPVVNGRPNTRGGRFNLSGHNARQFVCEGRPTGATPDGRRKGEEFSKNLSPTMGVDTEGVTALISTLASLDSRDFPGDFPLDVMLLPQSVSGEKGLEAMRTLCYRYFRNGGLVIQFNIVDAEELRAAQAHPEKYENLQVRVCGWNVRWNDLCMEEQDAYIRRAECIMQ